jgi:hypothetical protein
MKLAARIATVLFVLAVPVFLITSNVRFVAGESWFYKHGFRDYHVDQTTGVSYSQLDASADDIVRYFEDDRSSLHIQVTIDGQDASLYNDKETAHMKDVKTLMRLVFRLTKRVLRSSWRTLAVWCSGLANVLRGTPRSTPSTASASASWWWR